MITNGRLWVMEKPNKMKKKLPMRFVVNVAKAKSFHLRFFTSPAA